MPGPVFAESQVEIHLDGKTLPSQAAAAGALAGRTFAAAFNRNLGQIATRMGRTIEQSDKLSKSLEKQSNMWHRLSANTRQWILIGSAIAAGGQQIATLLSAIGPGLITLGGALTGVAIGAGVMVAAFINLGDELDTLPPGIRETAAAFQRLGPKISQLRRDIRQAAFGESAEDFDRLGETVTALTPAFEEVARAVGRTFSKFTKVLAPGTKGFETLNKVILASGPIFEKVAAITGVLAQALGNAFANPAVQKSIQQLLDWVGDLFSAFERFTASRALDAWMQRADTIFGAVGRLLEATGKMLDDLVTDEAVNRLNTFLDTLADFMPNLGDLLAILGELDIFGILAQALNDFSDALIPLVTPLKEFFDGLNRIVGIAIDQWAQDLSGVAEAIAPIVQSLADLVNDVDEQTVRDIADALFVLAAGLIAIKGATLGVTLIASLTSSLKDLGKIDSKKLGKGLIAGLFAGLLLSFDSEAATAEDKMSQGLTAVFTGALLGARAGPIGALIGAAVAAIVTRISQEWELLTSEIDWNPFDNDWTEIFAGMGENFGHIGEVIMTAIQPGLDAVAQFFTDWLGSIGQFFSNFGPNLVLIWQAIFTNLGAALATFFPQLLVIWQGLFDGIISFFNTFGTNVLLVWQMIWNNVLAVLVTTWASIAAFALGAWNGFVAMWVGVWNMIIATVTRVWAQILGFLAGVWGQIAGFFISGGAQVTAIWQGVWNGVVSFFSGIWGGILSTARGAINTLIGIINGIIAPINRVLDAISSLTGGLVNINIPKLPGMASGGTVFGPTRALIGEAGPEMVIPLTRPLSQIDPSVRDAAALLRGQATTSSSSSSKTINVSEGAVQIHTIVPDGRLVGIAAIDALVAKALT